MSNGQGLLTRFAVCKANYKDMSYSASCYSIGAPWELKGIVGWSNSPMATFQAAEQGSRPLREIQNNRVGVASWTLLPQEGAHILLQARTFFKGMLYAEAAIVIRIRKDGGLITVISLLPASKYQEDPSEVILFEGRGDIILDHNDLLANGINIPGGYRRLFTHQEEINICFRVTQEEEIAPSPKVQTLVDPVTKEEVPVLISTPKRIVRLRRNT